MAAKTIISVGYRIPHESLEYVGFLSHKSLLDADIVIFNPQFPYLSQHYPQESYMGKPWLNDHSSFQLQESILHWRKQLSDAYEAGKSIFVVLSKPEDVYVFTGQKEYSGTGKNARTTSLLTMVSSYDSIPLNLEPVLAHGKAVKPCDDLKYFSFFWNAFSSEIEYQCYIEGTISEAFLITKSGNKVIAAARKSKTGSGIFVLMPPIDFEKPEFRTQTNNWSAKAKTFGHKFIDNLLQIDKAYRTEKSITPPPNWVLESTYRFERESEIETEIIALSTQISNLENQKAQLHNNLVEEGSLRRLLYEQSHQLEEAIIEGLMTLGFVAGGYKDSTSEFDVVFTSSEGEVLGEAEGKDNKAIDITKLRQLLMNREEYFNKRGAYPKGVLFGNPQRLLPLIDRTETFTSKCITSAKEHRFSLVLTPQLFKVVKYVRESGDEKFAGQCRKAIIEADGKLVEFPMVPETDTKERPTLDAEAI